MRHHLLLVCLYAVAAHFAFAAQPGAAASTTDEDVAAIEAVYATWREAVTDGDIPKYVSVLHPAVRMIPPGAEVVENASSYEAFLQPVFAGATYRIRIDRPARIDVVGDYAVAEYDYTIFLTLKDPNQQINQPGALTESESAARYFDVLRKDSQGQWKVWRHTWQNK